MRTRVIVILGLTLALLAALLMALRSQREALTAEVEQEQQYRRVLLLALRRTARLNSEHTVTAKAASAPAVSRDTDRPSDFQLMRGNPDYANAWRAAQRARFRLQYGALLEMLHVSADVRAKFLDIMTGAEAERLEINGDAYEQGREYRDPVTQKLRDESRAAAEAQLRQLLGDDGFTRYADYQRTIPVRGFVDGFAAEMASTEPITATQGETLARAVANASPEYAMGGYANPQTVAWQQVDEVARRILSPNQFETWQLGAAHNPYGGSRAMLELRHIYDDVVARTRRGSN